MKKIGALLILCGFFIIGFFVIYSLQSPVPELIEVKVEDKNQDLSVNNDINMSPTVKEATLNELDEPLLSSSKVEELSGEIEKKTAILQKKVFDYGDDLSDVNKREELVSSIKNDSAYKKELLKKFKAERHLVTE